MGNDPINGIDPDGGKKVHYDASGNHIETTHNNWFHNTFVGTKRFWSGESVSQNQFWELDGLATQFGSASTSSLSNSIFNILGSQLIELMVSYFP